MSRYEVTATSKSPAQVEVAARQFRFLIDQPEQSGGADEGPTPVEFSLAALAGCFNVVLHLVARERGVTISSLELSAAGDIDPSKLLGKETDARAGFQQVELVVRVEPDADPATIRELIEVAEQRCPVSDNLANTTPVRITLA